jgi:hypothetical protein
MPRQEPPLEPPPERIVARIDPGLVATLGELAPIHYAGGGAPADDRPAYVRAASAIRRSGSRLVIVQDDVNVLAFRDEAGLTEPVLLPVGEGGRRLFDDEIGNKHLKMDLEACAALPDGRLVLFGSGSKRNRERLVVLDPDGDVRLHDGTDLYARLRATTHFAGSELNLEGAVVAGDRLRLFQRGNGARRGDLDPVNATCDLDLAELLGWLDRGEPVPALQRIVQYDLGATGRARFGFTDATLIEAGRIAFVACAEDSADAVADGEVLGCRFGLIAGDDVRMADILDEAGRPSPWKLEGIERADDAATFHVVADMDRPRDPARLGVLCVTRR